MDSRWVPFMEAECEWHNVHVEARRRDGTRVGARIARVEWRNG